MAVKQEYTWGMAYEFSGSCGITTNLNAELLAISYGLDLAWNVGYKFVMSESNSQTALDLVREVVQHFHPYAPLVEHIRKFMSFAWTLTFHHTLCEENECADWLAKAGAASDQAFVAWNQCPTQLHLVLLAYALGVTILRLYFFPV